MAKGGAQPGSGRKPGSLNKSTLERIEVLKEYRQRIMNQADILFNAQLSLAVGVQYVYRVEIGEKGRMKSILVDDPEEIVRAIDEQLMGTVEQVSEGEKSYYTITTKEPNIYAIDSMVNRAFGKPKEEEPEATNEDDQYQGAVALLPDGQVIKF